MSLEYESKLIERCRRGDAQAWDELFDLHYAATTRFIFQISPDFSLDDAEEICQEAFLAVIRNIHTFTGASQLRTWIFRIAGNKARDYHDRQLAAKRGGGATTVSLQADSPGDVPPIDPPSPLPSPDELALNAERIAQVGQALDQIGRECREVIDLRYFGDLSYEEISAELHLNPKTVSSRLSKCLDRLEKVVVIIFSGKKPDHFPV